MKQPHTCHTPALPGLTALQSLLLLCFEPLHPCTSLWLSCRIVQYCQSVSNMGSDELQQLHQRFEWRYPEDNIQGVIGWALDEFRDMQASTTGSILILVSVLKAWKGLCFPSSAMTVSAVADC